MADGIKVVGVDEYEILWGDRKSNWVGGWLIFLF